MDMCKQGKEIKGPHVQCPQCKGTGQDNGLWASLNAAQCSLCKGCGVLLVHSHNGAPRGLHRS
ncbi:MAG TPA: hypothetical protein VJU79_09025 [Candidatus Dormibacteraeota bacterium]|nr:hypothetical protein [Candidatus Dormibacteraeota bacterium]